MAEFKATNFVNITGILAKKVCKFETSKNGKEFGKVDLTVRTSDSSQHTVSFMQMKYSTDKETGAMVENARYKALVTIAQEYVSLEEGDNASVVQISGSLDNDHYKSKQTGEVISTTKVKGFNVKRVESAEWEAKEEFKLHCVLKKMLPLVNVDGEQEALKLTVAIPMYNNNTELIDLVLRDEQGIAWLEDTMEINNAMYVGGLVVNKAMKVEAEQPTNGWGAKVSSSRTVYQRELLITGIEPMDEDAIIEGHPLHIDVINKGLEARAIKLTEIASQQDNTTPKTPQGFGNVGTVNADTIPF